MNKEELKLSEAKLYPYIVELTSTFIKVRITDPVTMYCDIDYIPYYSGQEAFTRQTENGIEITHHGLWKAENAVKWMKSIADFFLMHREEFPGFIQVFDAQYAHLSSCIEIARERKRQSRGHDRVVWLKKQLALEEEKRGLYSTLYKQEFGDNAIYIGHKLLTDLLKEQG